MKTCQEIFCNLFMGSLHRAKVDLSLLSKMSCLFSDDAAGMAQYQIANRLWRRAHSQSSSVEHFGACAGKATCETLSSSRRSGRIGHCFFAHTQALNWRK